MRVSCFIRIQLWFSYGLLLLSKVDHEFHRSQLDPWHKVSHGVACFVCDDCHSRDRSRFFWSRFHAMRGMKGETSSRGVYCFIRIQLWLSSTPLLLSKVDHEFRRSQLDPWYKVSHGVARFLFSRFCAMKGMKGETSSRRV